jgi:hypothetical protein
VTSTHDHIAVTDGRLRLDAAKVLAANDRGGWTKPAPVLYPHQWSWDSAFAAIGWAHVDLRRACTEQQRLFDAQWATGMIPVIVYDEAAPAGSYFPDSQRWDCAISPAAPAAPPHTAGLCHPPVHALALERIWTIARAGAAGVRQETAAYLRRVYPAVLAWHRYLLTCRDTEGSGLVTIHHPWESGADNSPRWDPVMATIEIGDLPPYVRRDTEVVRDRGQRPGDLDYDRYLWLVELLKRCEYDESRIAREHPFQVKDVFFSAVLVAANEALLTICDVVDAPQGDRALISTWIERGRLGLAGRWDPELQMCLDYDVRTGTPLRSRTFAALAPLVAGAMSDPLRAAVIAALDSPAFLGNPTLRWPVLPSTSPLDPAFEPRKYWRGPTWPVVNWLFWRALCRLGEPDRAESLRRASLDQIGARGCYEYFDPQTGEPLGSSAQSWTAAVALDWLAGSGAPGAPDRRPGEGGEVACRSTGWAASS